MKNNFKINFWTLSLMLFLAVGIVTGCSDDNDVIRNESGSSIEVDKHVKISVFALEQGLWELADSIKSLSVSLTSRTDNSVQNFDVEIRREEGMRKFAILIPKEQTILDGDYMMVAHLTDGRAIGRKLEVTFINEMLSAVHGSSASYPLKGKGTENEPYLISGGHDFQMFRWGLSQDEDAGAGLYFKQTGDIGEGDNPIVTGENDDNLYSSYVFAGHYDGGGQTINYRSLGKESYLGLFKELKSGAVIENLYIKGNISDAIGYVGLLAGKSEGDITIKNVDTNGYIYKYNNGSGNNVRCDWVGGLIGYAKGNLTFENCTLRGGVEGHDGIGGLVGKFDGSGDNGNGTLTATNIKDVDGVSMTCKGDSKIGFIAGEVVNANVVIETIKVKHTVSSGGKTDVYKGNYHNIGGLIGKAVLTGHNYIKNVKFTAPVQAMKENAGGLVGCMELNNASMTISDCKLDHLTVSADNSAGGLIGRISMDGSSVLRLGETNNNYIYVTVGTFNASKSFAGGLIGSFSGKLETNAKMTVNAVVSADDQFAGGLFGEFRDGVLQAKHRYFEIDSETQVRSRDSAGGLIGHARNAVIEGDLPNINFSSLPVKNQFQPICSVKVGDNNQISGGGIVGSCENVKLSNLCFGGILHGKEQIGGIAGYFGPGDISNCVNASVSIEGSSWGVGGVVGFLHWYDYDNVKGINCSSLVNYATVKAEASSQAGGIIGLIKTNDYSRGHMILRYLVNFGNVQGHSDAGGCVAVWEDDADKRSTGYQHIFDNCANYGRVSGKTGGFVGGIAGKAKTYTCIMRYCANHGRVEGDTDGKANDDHPVCVGGVVGCIGIDASLKTVKQNAKVRECYNSGEVSSGYYDSYVGGIVGWMEEGHDINESTSGWFIQDCFNAGKVSSSHDHRTGGIVGYTDWNNSVIRCINVGNVTSGYGIIGDHKGVTASRLQWGYVLEGVTLVDPSTDKNAPDNYFVERYYSESELKNPEMYNEVYDFNEIWDINSSKNDGYPYLRRCSFQLK